MKISTICAVSTIKQQSFDNNVVVDDVVAAAVFILKVDT